MLHLIHKLQITTKNVAKVSLMNRMVHDENAEQKQTYVSVHILQLPVHLASIGALTHAESPASGPTQHQTRQWPMEH